jgi:hypothetical protein
VTVKVYLATSGSYSDFCVRGVFARGENARAYALADDVEEYEVRDGPAEVRTWHVLHWNPALPDRPGDGLAMANPVDSGELCDFNGSEKLAEHRWDDWPPPCGRLVVQGWDLKRVRKVYSEQRAQYLARQEGIS